MLRALFLCEHHRLGLFMLVSAESCISVWTLKTRILHTCQCRELYFFVNTEDFDISYFSVPRAVFLCERSHGESSQQKQWAYPWWVLCVCLYQSQPVEVVWLESAKYHPPTHTHTSSHGLRSEFVISLNCLSCIVISWKLTNSLVHCYHLSYQSYCTFSFQSLEI